MPNIISGQYICKISKNLSLYTLVLFTLVENFAFANSPLQSSLHTAKGIEAHDDSTVFS